VKYLVTGHRGNLGGALLKQLPPDTKGLGRADWEELDSLLSGVDVVIHAASDIKNRADEVPAKWLDSNVMATARLLEKALEHKVKRFIFISSCAVYGQEGVVHEASELSPKNLNGLTKALGEELVQSFCKKHQMDYQIYRVFNTFGGEDHFSVVSKLLYSFRDGQTFNLFNEGKSMRDFIHVDDVASCITELANNEIAGDKTLNLGSGVPCSIQELFQCIPEGKLKVEHKSSIEQSSCTADLTKLRALMDFSPISILDFMNKEVQRLS
jgi:UDP-glucose 4-epimerase